MGGVRNGVTEEDPGQDLNKRVCVMGQCRALWDHSGRKGVKELLLAGHEEVPRGFGLRTGDFGDTAVGAGNLGRPAQMSTDYWEEPEK